MMVVNQEIWYESKGNGTLISSWMSSDNTLIDRSHGIFYTYYSKKPLLGLWPIVWSTNFIVLLVFLGETMILFWTVWPNLLDDPWYQKTLTRAAFLGFPWKFLHNWLVVLSEECHENVPPNTKVGMALWPCKMCYLKIMKTIAGNLHEKLPGDFCSKNLTTSRSFSYPGEKLFAFGEAMLP